MNQYLRLLTEGAVLIIGIILFLWIVLKKSRNDRKLNIRDALLSSEELEEHARQNALEHSVYGKQNLSNWPIPRMNDNYDFILSVYKDLNEDIQKKFNVPSAAEWILDNFYIIEEQSKGLRRDLVKNSYSKLPVLKTGNLKGYARIFALAVDIVGHTDGLMDEKILSDYLKAYQSHNVLFDREIWAIPMVIRLALIENIRHICENIKNTQTQWHKSDEVFNDWMESEGGNTNKAMKSFKDKLNNMDEISPSFIEHLFYHLRRSGRSFAEVLRTMDERLSKLGTTTEIITQKEHTSQSIDTLSVSNCISSLRLFSTLDWTDLFEGASFVEQILNEDPDGTYPLMDLFTRNYYRSRIEDLALRYGVSEIHIAKEALDLAKQASIDCIADDEDDSVIQCKRHVGFYLVGKGNKSLADRQEKSNKFFYKLINTGNKFSGILYLGSIFLITLLFVVIAIQYSLISTDMNNLLFCILAGIAVLIPSSEIAVNAVNAIVCNALKPAVFPRLELKEGIPENLSTIVVVPALLTDELRVKELLDNLESHYLSNKEENLYFTLIGAFSDSYDEIMKDDDKIINKALSGVSELNRKYSKEGIDKFYFFHRERKFNEKNNRWIGWERKRGALMEFNELVLGSNNTSFSYFSNKEPSFSNTKYIITLDSDTILPMGMAKKMIGTMAHPLNRPVIDKKRGIVIEGYGLMQPRIDIDSESSNKSLFARIFTGQEGIDPYANAISDVYQDLFGEGIFTGKGIYDLKVFNSLLKNAIPENAVLSHDLLEGSYVRTGLVTDLKLVDSYPSKYSSFTTRLHRWVRGDWQLLPLLFRKIFNRKHNKVSNPLSLLSKWKMFDNLRRSLISPALMILFALSFSILPGNIFFWIGFFLITITFPFILSIIGYLLSKRLGNDRFKRHMPVMYGIKAAFWQTMLTLIFLPYQAWLMMDAIFITLGRVLVTKKNLLEWVTSADADKSMPNTFGSYMYKMGASLFEAPVIFALAIFFKPDTAIISAVFVFLWIVSPYFAYLISKDYKEKVIKISDKDRNELGRITRKTWRYFEEFCDAKNHYLSPDNYQTDPPRGIAYRTSPTNIGLGLLAILTARDFGYIGTTRMIDLIEKTVSTIEGLDKWNGHLYNWYDTRNLKPLRPGYISTIDSGNLVSYLITLKQGLKDYISRPLVEAQFFSGIRDTLYCAGKEGITAYEELTSINPHIGNESLELGSWNKFLKKLMDGSEFDNIKQTTWKAKIKFMIMMFDVEMTEMMPGVDFIARIPPDLLNKGSHKDIKSNVEMLVCILKNNADLLQIPNVYKDASGYIGILISSIEKDGKEDYKEGLKWLTELNKKLTKAAETAISFIKKFEALIERIDFLSVTMNFSPLYVKKKQLFSIGYNIEDNKLSNSYYDLLASEARQTSYVCIARGEIPQAHWFKMGRALTVVDGYKGLVSWTGTMFEYLMPLLLMKSFKNTLLDETYSFVIRSQKKYGRQRNMPWGTSESGFNSLDKNFDYQYKAIGVPWLGLKRGLIEDAVATPYASFLALLVDPEGAIQNINRLIGEGLDGPYGLYEAVDYTPERLPFETKRSIIKSFMAHHQGMTILALNNFLNDSIMQKRFLADPAMFAARLLLQEKVPTNVVFTKETKEKVAPFKEAVLKEKSSIRIFDLPDPVLPKVHILTNGNYSIMITDKGTGYSKNKMVAVTRWREDNTLDPRGMFYYLRNVDTNYIWSATYSPLKTIPEKYEVVFTADKATFKRTDKQVETTTEVVVASGDNAEIRRISLKNIGDSPCVLELTSYFEVVLAPQATDVSHPAFSNLFVETGFERNMNCIVANRRPRSEADKSLWIANSAVIEGNSLGEMQFETDRMQIIGRGHNLKTPIIMERGKPLSNTTGPVLDPVMSIRVMVKIAPGRTVRISFITAVSESNESVLALIEKYSIPDAIEGAFRFALTRSQVETTYLNLDLAEIELYQNLLSHILFISPIKKMNQDLIIQNKRGQSSLWRYEISGDFPIVLVVLNRTEQVDILYDVLKAHEYWRLMDLKVDLVILSEEEYGYTLPLHSLISDIVLSSQTHDILSSPGDIFILDKNKILTEDISLLYAVARLVFQGDGRTMEEQTIITQGQLMPKTKQFTQRSLQFTHPAVNVPELCYFNGIGGFSVDGSEYVIHLDRGQYTPVPWINVIANPNFGFIVSEAGSGYTWCDNSREYKLTPWSNDVVSDNPGEILYIGDGDTGRQWTVTALPIREEEPYRISHGYGYSVFEHTSHGIAQKLTQHVPVNDTVKVSILNLKNVSDQKRHLTMTYYVRPILGVSDQVTAMHITTKAGKSGTLMIENAYNEDFANRICFIDTSLRERTITSDRKEFFGSGDISCPECLSREALSGTVGAGFDPCAAIQVKVTLNPNESRDIVFLLGAGSHIQEVNEISRKYRKISIAKESLIETKKFWKDKIDMVQVNTPTVSMNLMLNGWLQYQVISCRLWARSGFYQSGGAFGFRDQLQDCLAIAHIWPEISRAQILLHARHQFTQGDVQHWWHDPQGKGTRTHISDDLLWLPYVTSEYIRITGDNEILHEELSYLDDVPLAEFEDEKYGKPSVTTTKDSLYEHCVKAIDLSLKFGKHGLPLMGSGDWNDGMNAVGNKGFGESVWLGWFLISVLEMFAPLCLKIGDNIRADKYSGVRVKITASIEKNAWDGNWYRRAYFDNGLPLGSIQNNECKIDSIAQTWAVLSGAGSAKRSVQAMNSLEDYLVQFEDGIIKLLTPPFGEGDMEPGYIKGYLPGVRENGGQYTHAAVWVIIAYAKLGDGDKAWELFELINPINHTLNHMQYSRYKVEPYVMSADVYAAHPHTGRGGWTWYTGAAGWMYRAGLEYILGFQKNGDTIIMDPCIPRKWNEYNLSYKYLDTNYDIKVLNPEGQNKGVRKISIDGISSAGNKINLVNDGKTHNVEVHMGL